MKKFFVAFLACFLLAGAASAQTTPTKKKEAKTEKKTDAQATKSTATKKDGTPDMRYKENKEAAKAQKAAGPVKKDGTPDKRYKANKTAPAKS